MKKILFFTFTIFASTVFAQSQIHFLRNDSIPVVRGTDTLSNPWAGGLNFCQFSVIDLDLNGTDDLFVFDRTGNKISPWINEGNTGEIKYRHAPEYISQFPKMDGWVLLRDYNCDGMQDIFTYGSGAFGGIDVYKNVSTIQSGHDAEFHELLR